jgi:subtilase family serine protease
MGPMQPGATHVYSVPFPEGVDQVTAYVTADADDVVPESNEDNNASSITCTVPTITPTPTPTEESNSDVE